MTKILTTLLIALVAAVVPAAAVNKNTSSKNTTSTAHQAADTDEMTYASISKTNPFEIVPAAGMELLEGVNDSETSVMVADMIS